MLFFSPSLAIVGLAASFVLGFPQTQSGSNSTSSSADNSTSSSAGNSSTNTPSIPFKPGGNLTFSLAEQGPFAFWWPPNRQWSEDKEIVKPCGSQDNATTYTEFPLKNGQLSLKIQDYGAQEVRVRIMYGTDLSKDSEFVTLWAPGSLPAFEPGQYCLPMPALKAGAKKGDKATIQVTYYPGVNDSDSDSDSDSDDENDDNDSKKNQSDPADNTKQSNTTKTDSRSRLRSRRPPPMLQIPNAQSQHFVCSDVVFVDDNDFAMPVPCLNMTNEVTGGNKNKIGLITSGNIIRGRDFAFIIVGGCIVFVAILGAVFYFNRKRNEKKVLKSVLK